MPRRGMVDPLERARGYGVRRDNQRRHREAEARRKVQLATEFEVDPTIVGDPDDYVEELDTIPYPDQDFLGRQFEIQTDDPLAESRVVQLQRDGGGGFHWKDLLNDEGEWNAPHLLTFGTLGTGSGEFTDGIRGIAIQGPTGDVFVASGEGPTSKVQKFTANGTYISTIATYGTGTGQVDTPHTLRYFPPYDELFVVDYGNNCVHQFNATTGAHVYTFGPAVTSGGNVFHPVSIDFLYHYDAFGETYVWWAFVISPEDEHVYAAAKNSPMADWYFFSANVFTPDDIEKFYDIVLLPKEEPATYYYVNRVDSIGEIRRWAWDGVHVRFGGKGSGKGKLDTPYAIAIDAAGHIYVTDSGNHRVQVYDAAGIFRGTFGSLGTADGAFNTPTAITITDEYIYVADSENGRVQVFANPAIGSKAPGVIEMFTGGAPLPGSLLCDGAAYSRTQYARLFAVIGTRFGSGDGSTTFNVPNMGGRVPVGVDAGQAEFASIGQLGGEINVLLTQLESGLRAHAHTAGGQGSVDRSAGGANTAHPNPGATSTHPGASAATPHNNLQPYVTVNFCIYY